jgi:hypothetical protein
MGNIAFGILWFSVAFMPIFAILGSIGLVGLYYLWTPLAVSAFGVLWGVTFVAYLFQTLFSYVIDPKEAKRSWFEGLAFPGLASLAVMAIALLKPFAGWPDFAEPGTWSWGDLAAQLILGWTAISTAAAWALYRLDKAGVPKWLRNPLLVVVGYGPVLCAIALAAIIAELRKSDLKWDKTIKSGKVRIQT